MNATKFADALLMTGARILIAPSSLILALSHHIQKSIFNWEWS